MLGARPADEERVEGAARVDHGRVRRRNPPFNEFRAAAGRQDCHLPRLALDGRHDLVDVVVRGGEGRGNVARADHQRGAAEPLRPHEHLWSRIRSEDFVEAAQVPRQAVDDNWLEMKPADVLAMTDPAVLVGV